MKKNKKITRIKIEVEIKVSIPSLYKADQLSRDPLVETSLDENISAFRDGLNKILESSQNHLEKSVGKPQKADPPGHRSLPVKEQSAKARK